MFVKNLGDTYLRQLSIRNTADETRFNTAVLENNLPLEDQLAYREEQLKRVADDPNEVTRVKGEISALKDRIEQKQFADDYLGKLIDYESGITSIDSVIDWLENQENSATDETIKTEIRKQLVQKQSEKYELTKQLLTNQTQYAINDKTTSVLNDQISKVNKARNDAMLAGDDTLASMYDLQIQSLKKAKTETAIENDMKNFAVSSITGYSSATKLLDEYNKKIATAETSGPVTIGGVTYKDSREFWTYKRDSYVSDQSASGFFGQLANEYETKIAVANSKNSLTSNMLEQYAREIDKLAGRSELNGYDLNIQAVRQGTLQTGADDLATKITNKYAVDYDINKAIGEINSLKTLGVNTDKAYASLITSAAGVKQGQVNNILAAAQVALQNDPSLTPEMALQRAIATGAGAVLSPTELATKNESEIANSFSTGAQNESFGVDPRLTVGTPASTAPGVTPNSTTPASTYAGGSIVDYLNSIGQASSFSARAQLASQVGITNYTGSAQQNTQLLNSLRGNQPAPSAQPSTPTSTYTPQPTKTSQPSQPAVTQPQQPKPSTQTPSAPKSTYQGGSVVDYLSSVGQDASFAARSKIAKQQGITNYTGTAQQNTQLLKSLRGF